MIKTMPNKGRNTPATGTYTVPYISPGPNRAERRFQAKILRAERRKNGRKHVRR